MSGTDDEWDEDHQGFSRMEKLEATPPAFGRWELEAPEGFRFKTDGFEKDHKQAMDVLRAALDAAPTRPLPTIAGLRPPQFRHPASPGRCHQGLFGGRRSGYSADTWS